MATLDHETAFQFALATERLQGVTAATRHMQRLAPDDDSGFGPAHVWLAKKVLTGEVASDSPSQQIETHLTRAIEHLPVGAQQLEARQLLAFHYYRAGRLEKSVELLKSIVDASPESGTALATALKALGQDEEAAKVAGKLSSIFADVARRGTELTADQYLRWAEVLHVLEDHDQVEKTLTTAKTQHPNSMAVRQALSKLYFKQSAAIQARDTASLTRQLQLLEKAFQANPADTQVLAKIAELSRFGGAQAQKADAILKPVLAAGKAPAIVHLILGSLAGEQGDHQRAVLHLEQACSMNPAGAQALNNLAWVLAHQDTPDLDRAMELVSRAIAIDPSATFYETRGQIHFKRRRWKASIADLEMAMSKGLNTPELHDSLAASYAAAGDEELAKIHEKNADQLRKTQD